MVPHPQIQTFLAAAAALKEERYWEHSTPEEQISFLRALEGVLTEVCYQLDRHQVLEPAAMEAFRAASSTALAPGFVDTSAEVILMGSLGHRIDQLRKQARNTR